MIEELRVQELGVIADLLVRLGPGLTAITGETGAGKTLIVEALELVLGGRADSAMVRAGAEESIVEGRFDRGEDELIMTRVVPRAGRSRATLNGRMAPIALLEESGRELVDLYGQHAHQSLLRPGAQRNALDQFAGVDLEPVHVLRAAIADLNTRLGALGGDDRTRARELDLLVFELAEIDRANLSDGNEDARLLAEEEVLAEAGALREAATASYAVLEGGSSDGVVERLGEAVESLGKFVPLAEHAQRLRALQAEIEDSAGELRRAAEGFEEDPERLAEVQERRQLLARLVRKHGETLADVLVARDEARARVAELSSFDELRGTLEVERTRLVSELAAAAAIVGDARRTGAHSLGPAIAARFAELALVRAQLSVVVPEEGIGDEVEFLFSANPGEPPLPLGKVASGGELARVMLALRLVLSQAPPTLVFDEVDAGIGGETALAVGRALASLARTHQVLVVTHLAQVAAFADQHLVVDKDEREGRTIALVRSVEGEERIIELSRMLSGHPDSSSARQHAAELLASAAVS